MINTLRDKGHVSRALVVSGCDFSLQLHVLIEVYLFKPNL